MTRDLWAGVVKGELWDTWVAIVSGKPWTVPVRIVDVHDGDSLTVDADLGWRITMRVAVRVAHINAPELATPEGKVSRDNARLLAPPGTTLTLTSHGMDKYGRSLGTLELPDGSDFGTLMVSRGYAVPYEGGPRGLGRDD